MSLSRRVALSTRVVHITIGLTEPTAFISTRRRRHISPVYELKLELRTCRVVYEKPARRSNRIGSYPFTPKSHILTYFAVPRDIGPSSRRKSRTSRAQLHGARDRRLFPDCESTNKDISFIYLLNRPWVAGNKTSVQYEKRWLRMDITFDPPWAKRDVRVCITSVHHPDTHA